ncbi:MAG: hypothetical protein ACOZNI_03855 [Myxococcota bacterium]
MLQLLFGCGPLHAGAKEEACPPLSFDAVVEAWGEPCTTCDLGRPLDLIGRIGNQCSGAQTVVSGSTCLVARWEVVDTISGDLSAYYNQCDDAITRFEVPADDVVDVWYTWGTLPVGDYTLRVVWDESVSEPVERAFRVRERGY